MQVNLMHCSKKLQTILLDTTYLCVIAVPALTKNTHIDIRVITRKLLIKNLFCIIHFCAPNADRALEPEWTTNSCTWFQGRSGN